MQLFADGAATKNGLLGLFSHSNPHRWVSCVCVYLYAHVSLNW